MFGWSGTVWALIGVAMTFGGTLLAFYGAYLNDKDDKRETNKIIELSAKNAELNEELRLQATGGDSIFYLDFERFGEAKPLAVMRINGEYPVRGVHVEVFDISSLGSGFRGDFLLSDFKPVFVRQVDVVYPNSSLGFSNLNFDEFQSRDFCWFYIIVNSSTGRFIQDLRLSKVNGGWIQEIKVRQINRTDGSEKVVFESLSE